MAALDFWCFSSTSASWLVSGNCLLISTVFEVGFVYATLFSLGLQAY